MKQIKLSVIALCAALTLTLGACGADASGKQEDNKSSGSDGAASSSSIASSASSSDANAEASSSASAGNAGLANPWTDLDTLEAAEELAGFSITVPEQIDGNTQWLIRVNAAQETPMIELIYKGSGEKETRIRKAPGEGDISGDHNSYANTETAAVEAVEATMRGNGQLVSLAVWNHEGYAFSISVSDGIPRDHMAALIAAVQ